MQGFVPYITMLWMNLLVHETFHEFYIPSIGLITLS